MKASLFTIFRILIGLVILGKVLNWFLDFSDETNHALNVAMYSLIGIAYLVMGYVWNKTSTRIIITLCGLFLILMNFFESSIFLDIAGILCILIPMLIARFYKEETGNIEMEKGQA